ncbi:MAG: hypothetical protein HOQ38_20290, partial [Nonomuraea sp.]|nr:hypothetical protein [Nonomuraea sp.]
MANTVAGPLISAWKTGAEPEALARVLLPPGGALPVPPAGAEVWERHRRGEALLTVREQAEAEAGTPWPQPL